MQCNKVAVIATAILLAGVIAYVLVGRMPLATPSDDPSTIRFLPLGDSYTIGQSVDESERWPNQLAARIDNVGTPIAIVDNPAVTGYTSQDLIDRELGLVSKLKPTLISVQIGVNDYVQGIDQATFDKNLRQIAATIKTDAPAALVVFVTIPDYAKTPAGARFGNVTEASLAISQFNESITQIAAQNNFALADIFTISQGVVGDAGLTAKDGLHPSGSQYELWEPVIYDAITDRLPMLNVQKK